MLNNEYKNTEIAKIIQAIASERRINNDKIFQITKLALLEVLTHIYGKAQIDIEINKNYPEMQIMHCYKVLDDNEALEKKYFYDDQIDDENEHQFSQLNSEFSLDNLEMSNNQLLDYYQKFLDQRKDFHYSVMSLTQAKNYNPDIKSGEILKMPIPNAWQNLENNNRLAKMFGKIFLKYIDILVKEQELIFFSRKENQMISAVVKSINKDGYILKYDNYDIILPAEPKSLNKDSKYAQKNKSLLRSEIIPGEYFGIGERVSVFIKLNKIDPNKVSPKYQIIASRTHYGFLAELMKQNVPEIRSEQIIVKDIQRIPGVRAKVVVFSTDTAIDPVGACIGIKGVRVKSISKELRGEKIDVISYTEDLYELAVNCLYPIKILKINESQAYTGENKVVITVEDKDLSNAIGKSGSNIKLTSRILKTKVEIIGSTLEESRRIEEYNRLIEGLKEALDVEEVIAQILVINNYKTVEDLAYVEIENLMQIEYFDEELASELQNRALEYLYNQEQQKIAKIDLELRELIKKFDNEDQDLLKAFSIVEIFTLKSLAEMDIDELIARLSTEFELSEEVAESLIINAREITGFTIV